MDEPDNDPPARRAPRPARAFAVVAAALALTTGMSVALVSVDDSEPAPSASPAPDVPPSPEPTGEPEEEERKEPPLVVRAGAPDVYDFAGDVRECASSRRSFPGAAGTPGFEDDVARISKSVERIRGLELEDPVDTRLVPREEIGRRFAQGLGRQYSPREAAIDERILGALGLVPEGIDLWTLSQQVAAGTAAGFYNPRTKRLYARASGATLTPYDEVVLAHEIDHALVDQVLRLPGTLGTDPMLADVMLAHQALAEGDATLAMSKYGAGTLDQAALDAFLGRFSSPLIAAYPGVPYFLQRGSGFPYYEGMLFACAAWKRGGWSAIDDMYRRPPGSTAEIIFPWRYRRDASGELPPSPPAPGESWRRMLVASFGAFDLMVMLENADVLRTGRAVPGSHVQDVRGWNGGVLSAWGAGDRTAVHISLLDAGVTGDGRRRRNLCGVLRGWVERTFRAAYPLQHDPDVWLLDDGFGGLRCEGGSVRVALAPSEGVVRALLRP